MEEGRDGSEGRGGERFRVRVREGNLIAPSLPSPLGERGEFWEAGDRWKRGERGERGVRGERGERGEIYG